MHIHTHIAHARTMFMVLTELTHGSPVPTTTVITTSPKSITFTNQESPTSRVDSSVAPTLLTPSVTAVFRALHTAPRSLMSHARPTRAQRFSTTRRPLASHSSQPFCSCPCPHSMMNLRRPVPTRASNMATSAEKLLLDEAARFTHNKPMGRSVMGGATFVCYFF
jgi:hypothetical protein